MNHLSEILKLNLNTLKDAMYAARKIAMPKPQFHALPVNI